jgi:hypothetical protein
MKMMPFSECHMRAPLHVILFYPAVIAAATVIFAGPVAAQIGAETGRELNCQSAPDDCAPLHICLSDGRRVEGYTTPGFRGRTWLADISTGGGCDGQLNEGRPSGLLCMTMERQDTDDFIVTLTPAEDGSLRGSGVLEDGTAFDVFGSMNAGADVAAECTTPAS